MAGHDEPPPVQRDHHDRGVQADRGQRVDRDALRPVAVERGHHGDPGRELAHHGAEVGGRDVHALQSIPGAPCHQARLAIAVTAGALPSHAMSTDTTPTPRPPAIERDSMGEMEVPADALYGASTQRAVLNFPISGQRMPRRFLRALALVKLAAAETNQGLGPAGCRQGAGDRRRRARRRRRAATTSTSRSTSTRRARAPRTNTNMNEVISHLASARLGGAKVHPNDDVNKCQSSNDTIPTALQLSGAVAIEEELIPALIELQARARREGRRVLGHRQDRPHAPPGRDADPPRPGVRGLRGPGRGGDPARPGRARRAADRAAGRDGGRDRDQRPSRVRGAGLRPPLAS